MLSDATCSLVSPSTGRGLNAPCGAPCFLTELHQHLLKSKPITGLYAPYGARCFLTQRILQRRLHPDAEVLMHLIVLRAF